MADTGDGDPPRLHPDDLRVITEALKRGVAPGYPVVDTPPAIATGADATLFRRIVREEIERNKQAIAAPDALMLREVVREEIARDHVESRDACRRMIKEEVREILADLEMPIDQEHIVDTRKKLSGIFEGYKQRQSMKADGTREAIKIVLGWMGAAAAAGLAVFFGGRGNGH